VPIRIISEALLLDWLMHALNRHSETFGTDINAAIQRFLNSASAPSLSAVTDLLLPPTLNMQALCLRFSTT
jgi:hypothetical protein